jgi:hypothetical protein
MRTANNLHGRHFLLLQQFRQHVQVFKKETLLQFRQFYLRKKEKNEK